MLVLLTRAVEDAARTQASLEQLGHRVLLAPVISIERLPAIWPAGPVDAVVATSSQAFRALPRSWGPSSEARRLLPLWLVGRRTEEAARAAGYEGAATVAGNAVMLALQMNKRPPGRVVYLAGRHRKADIETALAVTNQATDVVEVYAAREADAFPEHVEQALERSGADVALHYSRRSAELFANLLARNASSKACIPLHLCLSDDVAEPLRSLGWTVRVAPSPDEEALLSLIPPAT